VKRAVLVDVAPFRGVTSSAVSAIVVVTTAGTQEEANLLAEELVARRHSCCVNILPIQRSVYRWQGKICDDSEYMLIIKTLESEYKAVEGAIQELHSYDLPEILAFNIHRGEAGFLTWITTCLNKGAESLEDEA
jgi:periplasmic divalent cation tolerance protein